MAHRSFSPLYSYLLELPFVRTEYECFLLVDYPDTSTQRKVSLKIIRDRCSLRRGGSAPRIGAVSIWSLAIQRVPKEALARRDIEVYSHISISTCESECARLAQ